MWDNNVGKNKIRNDAMQSFAIQICEDTDSCHYNDISC